MILAAAQDATPSGAPDPDLVTPGTIGFLATLAIVVVVLFLIRDALKRVRRVRARSQADDAYPIPLRKHAVPNQSKLSGESAPSDEDASTQAEAASTQAEDASTQPEAAKPEPENPEPVQSDSDQSGPTRP